MKIEHQLRSRFQWFVFISNSSMIMTPNWSPECLNRSLRLWHQVKTSLNQKSLWMKHCLPKDFEIRVHIINLFLNKVLSEIWDLRTDIYSNLFEKIQGCKIFNLTNIWECPSVLAVNSNRWIPVIAVAFASSLLSTSIATLGLSRSIVSYQTDIILLTSTVILLKLSQNGTRNES